MRVFDPPMPVPEVFDSWFRPYPHIRGDGDLEGMRVTSEGLVLGMRAGPGVAPDMLCHEMAHLIETSDDRICQPNWGMHYPRVELLGREYPEPVTSQGCHREMRTWGIQAALARLLGVPVEDHAEECRYLMDECCFRDELGLLGDEAEDLSYDESLELGFDVARACVHYESIKWDAARLRSEWARKCQLIERNYAQGLVDPVV